MSAAWVVHISARYPMGPHGTAVAFWQTSRPTQPVLDGYGERASDELSEMVVAVTDLYHEQIGPACDDFVYTVWAFDDLTEMFHTCGPHLLETDGVVADWAYP